MSSHESDSNDTGLGALEARGYTSPQINTFLSPTIYTQSSPSLSRDSLIPSPRRRRLWPDRPVVDFLIGMFLKEMNRVHEMIHPPSFQSNYNAWWTKQEQNNISGETIMSDDDMNFGLLVIRICLVSIQCLPHSKFPTEGIIRTSPYNFEQWLYSIADEIDKSLQSKKPSLVTVQHRFYHVCYLKAHARIRECWSILSATVKDAHEIGLHLKDPGAPFTELEMEIRRRTFWNLYIWDRFMSSFFGHWPLIPEGYFDIEPPHDNLQAFTITPYVLTPFTDRVFVMKLARFITAFMSPPSWQHDRVDSVVIADFSQRFQQVIIDQLPHAFWLENPDTTWDSVDSALPGKRETLHLCIWVTKAGLYKAFADPCRSLQQQKSPVLKHGSDLLALAHRRTLMETTCKVISSVGSLYMLLGDEEAGSTEKLFFLPICLVEALANLGVCLLSIQADEKILTVDGIRFVTDPDLARNYLAFFEGYGLLCRQSSRQAIARKSVDVLKVLHDALRASFQAGEILDTHGGGAMSSGSLVARQYGAGQFQLEHALVSLQSHGGEASQGVRGDSFFPLPGWLPSFMASPGRSWLFHDKAAFGDLMA
ncbi:hypothetical protein N7494_004148 [Penicillium frequentans]|uniref:Xylanolytic transcriptional activator regulatory domain-containing protein n=1 Tax=Penicillium frequentans TaxID=3151616 RepID=A0AAD6D2H3_9EURO|nr:hypothetical protein N7494_004148 [Penicillium glabrum]